MTLSTTSPGDERLPHADSVQQPSESIPTDDEIRDTFVVGGPRAVLAMCFHLRDLARFGTRPAAEPDFFTASEIKAMEKWPDALRAIADWHDWQETQGDASDMPREWCDAHKHRRVELKVLAEKLEMEAEND